MSLYRHIVVGTDFSNQSDAAVNVALTLALKQFARLSILHIIDERVMQYQEVLPLAPTELEEMLLQETRRKLLNILDEEALDSLACEVHVIFGKPHLEIERYAQHQQGELIIVGQRGKQVMKNLLLGSTAERLLRHSTIPTLVVHPESSSTFNKLLVPVDFSEASRAALEHALHLCQSTEAELHVLHVCEETPFASLAGLLPLNETEGMRNSYEERVKKDYEKFLDSIDFQGISYERHFRRGPAATEIQLWADELDCDLIIMGSVGRTGVRGMLIGNTAERVARTLPCSLLVVKPDVTV